MTRLSRLGIVALAAVSLSGCAALWSGWDLAPSGLTRDDERLRGLLRAGRADSALRVAREEAPSDELLRHQYVGILAHYAGDYRRSNEALQRAARLAEDRYTRSLTRGLLSFLSNDRVLPYRPPRSERCLLHYYGILNYLALGDAEAAAVEARRLVHLLEVYEDDGHALEGSGARLHAALRTLAGAAFEAAGEWNDARVAYRNAARIAGGASAGWATDALDRSIPADSGDVLVVVERGFVAHRVERSLDLLLWPGEITLLGGQGPGGRSLADQARWSAAVRLAEGLLARDGPGRRPLARPGEGSGGDDEGEGDGPRLFRAAWPVMVGGDAPPLPRTLEVAGAGGWLASETADLAAVGVGEFREDEPEMLAKALLRAVAKHSVSKLIEEEVEEKDELLGEIAGLVTSAGFALMERADTRGWHLLPGRLGLYRLRLPAGPRHLVLSDAGLAKTAEGVVAGPGLALARGGPRSGVVLAGAVHAGAVRASPGFRVEVGAVNVRPGGLAVVSVRRWR